MPNWLKERNKIPDSKNWPLRHRRRESGANPLILTFSISLLNVPFAKKHTVGFYILFNKRLDKNDMPKISNSIDQPNLAIWFRLNRLLDRPETACADLFWAIFYDQTRQNLIRPPTSSNEGLFDYRLFREKPKKKTSTTLNHTTHRSNMPPPIWRSHIRNWLVV